MVHNDELCQWFIEGKTKEYAWPIKQHHQKTILNDDGAALVKKTAKPKQASEMLSKSCYI